MSAERSISPHEHREQLQPPESVVAVYPWAVAMPDQILKDLESCVNPSCIRVLLGQKPDNSGTLAAGMISPIRAHHEGEVTAKTVVDAIRADTTLYPVPIDLINGDGGVYIADNTFDYSVPGSKRRLTVSAAPVLPPRIAQGNLTFSDNQEGWSQIIPIRPEELTEAISTGQYRDRQLVESGSKAPPSSDGLQIDDENVRQRDRALDSLTAFFGEVDKKIKLEITRRAHKWASTQIDLGDFDNNPDLIGLYNLIHKELESDYPSVAVSIISEAVEFVRTNLFLDAYRQRESAVEHKEFEGGDTLAWLMQETRSHFNGGMYGVDALEAAAIETLQSRADTTGNGRAVLNETTHTYELFNDVWSEAFDEALRATGLRAADCFVAPGEVTTALHSDNLKRVSDMIIELLGTSIGKDRSFAMAAVVQSFKFLPYIAVEIEKEVEDASMYQAHDVKNEVQTALIAKLYHNAMTHENPKIRFESKRQLWIILKYLYAMEDYIPIIEGGNEYFDTAINEFFGSQMVTR
jgi:hypothetical protein